MRVSILLRGMLASVVALTPSRAAVAGKRDCSSTDSQTGRMVLMTGTKYVSISIKQVGYIGKVPYNTGFGVVTDVDSAATFHFTGCVGGPEATLYCINCDRPFSDGLVAIRSTSVNDYNEPNGWWIHNAGPDPSWLTTPPTDGFVYSQYFTWGTDNVIRPVTYLNSAKVPNTLEEDLLYDSSSATELLWADPTEDFTYYYILWEQL